MTAAPEPGASPDMLSAQRAIFRSALPSSAKLVLLALVDHWSPASPKPFPSSRRLADWTSMDERTVRRVIRELQALGVLGVQRSRCNSYDLRAVFEGQLPERTPGVMPGPNRTQRPEPTGHGARSGAQDRASCPIRTGHSARSQPGMVPTEGSQGRNPREAERARAPHTRETEDPDVLRSLLKSVQGQLTTARMAVDFEPDKAAHHRRTVEQLERQAAALEARLRPIASTRAAANGHAVGGHA